MTIDFMARPLRREVLHWLEKAVTAKRRQHILRVEAMAIALAQQHNLAVDRAQQAGLMHDLAKCFTPSQLLAVAEAEGWTLDPAETDCPHLLHASVGAVVARDTFGVTNPQVLNAIAHHTLGSPDMDALGCVVYVADSLEPGRGDTPQLQHLRQLSYRDLWGATYETCVASLQHLLENRRPVHPRTILTHNSLLPSHRHRKAVSSAA